MTEKLLTEQADRIAAFDTAYAEIKARIARAAEACGKTADDIILLAATKTVPTEVINHAIKSGIDYVGENRVQEFLQKDDSLLKVHKHFIGHLQTNKVKDIVGRVEMIQSVDSLKLAKEISKQSSKKNTVTDILLEVNIGDEASKSGFAADEVLKNLTEIAKLDNIRIKGLMSIPPICTEKRQLTKYFAKMHNLFVDIQGKNIDNSNMEYLSMGMSQDFDLAIENGANLVRVGSALFGNRIYPTKQG